MSSPSPLQALPTLSPAAAQMRRVMLDRRMAWRLSGATGLPVRIEGRGEGPKLDTVLVLQSETGVMELGVSTGSWPTLRMLLACGSEPLRQAALADFMAPLLAALRPGLGTTSLIALKPGHGYRAMAPLVSAARVHCSVLALPRGAMDLLSRWLASAPVDDAAVRLAWAHLRLPVRLKLGQIGMPLATLALKGAGAWLRVARLEAAHSAGGLRVTASWGEGGRCTAEARIDLKEDSVSLVEDFDLGTGQPTEAGIEPPPTSLGGLQVPISFEVDTALVSLAELTSMRAGQVLTLDTPLAEAPVRLVCHGQVVGVGQLLAVGDQLGVRLQRIGLPT